MFSQWKNICPIGVEEEGEIGLWGLRSVKWVREEGEGSSGAREGGSGVKLDETRALRPVPKVEAYTFQGGSTLSTVIAAGR